MKWKPKNRVQTAKELLLSDPEEKNAAEKCLLTELGLKT